GDLGALQRMQHDLAVHQEELELQNQQLIESRREIEESHERYVDLFDMAPVGYVTIDDTGLICNVNLQASAMLEPERARQVGIPFFLHVVQEDRRAFLDYFARFRRAVERSEIELRLRTRTGKVVPVLITMRRSHRDRSARYSVALIDLRERQRAEMERRRA